MSKPSGFRTRKQDDGKTQAYPIFDTTQIGRPLKSSKSMGASREQIHQIRAARIDREMQEQAYAQYVAKGFHGQGDIVVVSTPARTTSLKLTTVKTDDVKFREESPYNLEERSAYFQDAIKRGKTVPPILVHKLPDGTIEVIDGHARLDAYRKLGVKEVPAVENSIGDVLGKIGRGIGRGAKAVARAPSHVHFTHLPKEEEKDTGKLPPPPSRIEHIKRLRGTEVAIGKAQAGVKRFREVIKPARLRILRRRIATGTPEEKKKAKLALINEFPEYA
jgi:hypothetical protein